MPITNAGAHSTNQDCQIGSRADAIFYDVGQAMYDSWKPCNRHTSLAMFSSYNFENAAEEKRTF